MIKAGNERVSMIEEYNEVSAVRYNDVTLNGRSLQELKMVGLDHDE